MSHYRITPEGVFALRSIDDVTITGFQYEAIPEDEPMYHIYKFHVRAKIDPGSSNTTVSNAEASVEIETSTHTQDMQKENGDPADHFYKTVDKIEFFRSAPLDTDIVAVVKATFFTVEDVEEESAPYDPHP